MILIPLKEHQVDQKSSFRNWVGFPARSFVPPEGARAMGVSATGSGKTITSASCALEYFPGGRILVMVPTLDLVVQSAQSWRRVGHRAPMVAVCSVDRDEVLEQLGVRTTTNPIQLALWAGSGPVVVFATYASLVDREDPADVSGRGTVPGPLESALAGGERLYGQRMAPFDLAILDEGHMTAGDMGRPWAAIHDNSRIPVDFRLYLTATPRILAAPRPQRGRDGREVVIASMEDDSSTYGTRIFDLGLAEAVERSILAGFEIDVLEIRDPDPVLGLSEDALRGRRMALLQAALLEHAAEQNLHTTMVFHQRVEEAEAFAGQMPSTAAELYAAEASAAALAGAEALPASSIGAELYELEEGRHVHPGRVWADWLCGDHPIAHRRAVIQRFANGIDAHNRRVHRAFLSSVRALGVGVDITGLRGVEAVCIVGSRSSQVDVVQNIGRALRPNPDGRAKTARIIIPVFLQPGEDPKDMIASASYQPLVDILQALRSHSERMVDQLASHALTRSTERRRIHIPPAPAAGPEGGEMPAEVGEEQQEVDRVTSIVVNFASPRDAADIAALTRCRVIRPESLVWLEGYQALIRWRTENKTTGLHAVPYDTETAVGVTRDYPLGRWIHQQRKALRAGELDTHRKTLLDEAGMVWEPGDEAWEKKLAALRSYRRATGHLAPRQDAVWGEGEGDGEQLAIGQLLANLRRKNGLGKDPQRAEARAAQLTEIDPDWNCPWPLDWQRHYRVLADLVDADGSLPVIDPGVLFEGDDIGRWLERQKNPGTWAQLSAEQQERLTRLGIKPVEALSPAPAVKGATEGQSKAQQAFQRGLAALTQWVEREGADRPVPRGHAEEIAVDGEADQVIVKLGVWVSNTRARRDKLTAEQLDALRKVGMEWAKPVPAIAAAPAQPAAIQAAPPKRDHHDGCDKALHEGGTCTCDLIEQYGPPSERDDY
ncbi:Helicase associated domain protein [Streptomyces globisporus]|uniref:DEAD/DEAH box helicase n=1 Tax=Streptomyces globisporus TaxID=1908 RepID=UPI003865E5A8|nr:Helicase associated domain protein [Streptomyces globisporus]WSU85631.1 Helicase associated domain protein [Streptomyces globisporus]